MSSEAAAGTPELKVVHGHPTSINVQVSDATKPFWLVLGQSYNKGWTAKLDGGASLGKQAVVDGFANGWYVDPGGRKNFRITLAWTPQRNVWAALALSATFFVACLAIALLGWRRRRGDALLTEPSPGIGPASRSCPHLCRSDATRAGCVSRRPRSSP